MQESIQKNDAKQNEARIKKTSKILIKFSFGVDVENISRSVPYKVFVYCQCLC